MKLTIRKAEKRDFAIVAPIVRAAAISFLNVEYLRGDIAHGCAFVMYDGNNFVGICSLIHDEMWHYDAIKRLYIAKEYRGKACATSLLSYVSNKSNGIVGCTPWIDNGAMRHILEELDFTLQYIFDDKWCYYAKQIG